MAVGWIWFQRLHNRCILDLPSFLRRQNPGKLVNLGLYLHKSNWHHVFSCMLHSRFETPKSTMTPSLLKKSALTPTSGTGSSSFSTERCLQQDSWRTMLLLQAISELWLSHVTTKENSNLRAGSPSRSQITALQVRPIFIFIFHLNVYALRTNYQ
jgi:hypothetical protein